MQMSHWQGGGVYFHIVYLMDANRTPDWCNVKGLLVKMYSEQEGNGRISLFL